MAPSKKTPASILPGLIIVGTQWLLWLVLPFMVPELFVVAVAASALGTLAFLLWFLFFSRFPAMERWGSLVISITAVLLMAMPLHESIQTGNMGLMYYMYVMPNLCLSLMLAILIGKKLQPQLRRLVFLLAILLAPGALLLVRSEGLNGEGRAMLVWRWRQTPEEMLLAAGEEAWTLDASGSDRLAQAIWPGFRGPDRNGHARGAPIASDWDAHPPELLWKQAVGPGCSSFAVNGDRLYTQEQRGEMELVSCYNLNSGGLIWKHEDQARFYDSHAGAGPRATPCLSGNEVYSLGGTGILNALDAQSGEVRWSRKAAEELGVEALTWGFCASPLVVDSAVIIALAGKPLAYHKASGDLLWEAEDGGNSYSSPQLFHIDGVPQVLFMSKAGCRSLDPANGQVLWTHSWEHTDRILQPAMSSETKLLLTSEMSSLRCLEISRKGQEWELHEKWTSEEMKLNFNDFVVHQGHAYGFDGPSLACLDLATGQRTWKGKRYRGWILLLPEQDLQLILSEKGDVALVEARADQFHELASIKALEGRTWNHPALAGDILLLRNSSEMAAYRLPSL